MKFGYCRVSTQDQNLDLQLDALKASGCEKIFQEKSSGRNDSREELLKMLDQLRPGDVVVVYKLCRLSRKMRHLLEVVEHIQAKGADFVSLSDSIDTSSPVGRFTFNIFAALNDYFIDNLRENTRNGIAAARSRGKVGGRPKAIDDSKLSILRALQKDNSLDVTTICSQLGISRSTFYRYVRVTD